MGRHQLRRFEVIGLGLNTVDFLLRVPSGVDLGHDVEVVEYDKQGGGMTATALVTLARLGAKTAAMTAIGDDEFGDFVMKIFRHEGVDVSHVVREVGEQTSVVFVLVDTKTGERSFLEYAGVARRTHITGFDLDFIKECDILHIDGYFFRDSLKAAKLARREGIQVSLDMSPQPGVRELIENVNILIPSEALALTYTGEKNPKKACRKLLSLGPDIVAITLGKRGVVCMSREEEIERESFKVQVRDTTGAGDVFHGAFVFGALRGWPLSRTVEFASAVAAIKCTKLGGQKGIPLLDEALGFLEKKSASHRIT